MVDILYLRLLVVRWRCNPFLIFELIVHSQYISGRLWGLLKSFILRESGVIVSIGLSLRPLYVAIELLEQIKFPYFETGSRSIFLSWLTALFWNPLILTVRLLSLTEAH